MIQAGKWTGADIQYLHKKQFEVKNNNTTCMTLTGTNPGSVSEMTRYLSSNG